MMITPMFWIRLALAMLACGQGSAAAFAGEGRKLQADACPAGKHHNATAQNSTACLACAAGQYQSAQGRSSCDDCPTGKHHNMTAQNSAASCKDWCFLQNPVSCSSLHPGSPSGAYAIYPRGAPLWVHCDMASDGGAAWTLVYKISGKSAMKTAGAHNVGALRSGAIVDADSGKLDDADIRVLCNGQYKVIQGDSIGELSLQTPRYCKFGDVALYGDGTRYRDKMCAPSYNASGGYPSGPVGDANYSYGFSTWQAPVTKVSGPNGGQKNLQACIGECDRDTDCAAGLKCFQRAGGEDIPGCDVSTASGSSWDYCYDPTINDNGATVLQLGYQDGGRNGSGVSYGSPGHGNCGTGHGGKVELEADCLAAAKAEFGDKVKRSDLVAGSWSNVPTGCSVKSGGGWAAHFNTRLGIGDKSLYTAVTMGNAGCHTRVYCKAEAVASPTCAHSPCTAGRYHEQGGQSWSCKGCPAGKYQSMPGQQVCAECAAGQHQSEQGRASCDECAAGQYQSAQGGILCDACAAGTYHFQTGRSSAAPCRGWCFATVNATCTPSPCVAGKYHEQAAQAWSCKSCPGGKYQGAAGTAACDNCIAGKFHDQVAQTSVAKCKGCPAGKYQRASGAGSCDNCVAGKYQGQATQVSCSNCTVGKYSEQVGQTRSTTCKKCPVGKFQSTTGRGLCEACTVGKYQISVGQAFCEDCAAGKFRDADVTADQPEAKACKGCAAGKYQDKKEAQTTCKDCAAGKVRDTNVAADQNEAIACRLCYPGRFSATGMAECELCRIGRYAEDKGTGTCSACAAGKTTKSLGTAFRSECICDGTDCCGPGFFLESANATACTECPEGRFGQTSGLSECAACQLGTWASSGQPYCEPCFPGTWGDRTKAQTSSGHCVPCARGRAQPRLASGACDACRPGRWQTKGGQEECDYCIRGQYQNVDGATWCKPCGVGTYQPYVGSAACTKHTACSAGQREISPPNATADRTCEECPPGHFSNQTNSKDCTLCAPCSYGQRLTCGRSFEGFCAACTAGSWFDTNTSECTPCRAGFWCQDGKMNPCGGANMFCPSQSATPNVVAVGHYSVPEGVPKSQREGQKACEPGFDCAEGIRSACPAGRVCQYGTTATVRLAGSDLVVNVTVQKRCASDEFVFNGTCAKCPLIGAVCDNGEISLLADHWYNPEYGPLTEFWGKRSRGKMSEETNIYRCAKGACTKDPAGLPACTEGRGGTLCAVCDDGYFATNSAECKKCPTSGVSAQYVLTLVIIVSGAWFGWKAWLRVAERNPKLAAAITEKLPEVLKLLTGMFQILGAFATLLYRVPWPGAFEVFSRVFALANFDLFSIPSLRCSSLASNFLSRFALHLGINLVLTGMFVALLMYSYSKHNADRGRPVTPSLAWNLFLPFLFLIYPSISRTVILVLRCVTVDGTSYLLSDMSLSCETKRYFAYRSFAVFGVIVYPIGVVVFFTVLLWYKRSKLPPDWWPAEMPERARAAYQEYKRAPGMSKPYTAWMATVWEPEMEKHKKIYKRFGFLFGAYTQRFWWFESLNTFYKLTMTVLILFVSDGDELKILFGMVGATAMMAVLAFFQPFKHPDILSINTGVQMVVLLVLFAAQYLLIKGGSNTLFALVLIAAIMAPLISGVLITVRLPKEALVGGADDVLADLAKTARMGAKKKKEERPVGNRGISRFGWLLGKIGGDGQPAGGPTKADSFFSNSNPMHNVSFFRRKAARDVANSDAARFPAASPTARDRTKTVLPRSKTALRAMTREVLEEPEELFGGNPRHNIGSGGGTSAGDGLGRHPTALSLLAPMKQERRQDTDGEWYTCAEFVGLYGRDDEWERSVRAPAGGLGDSVGSVHHC